MPLDDLLDDDDNSKEKTSNRGGDDSNYTRITQEEFEQFLLDREENWSLVKWLDTGELVYRTASFAPENNDLSLYCYSTIDKHSGVARDKGSDAIRLVVVYKDDVHLKIGRKKTLRIKTWKKNLRKKIVSLLEEGASMVSFCDDCGGIMTKREGKYGEFLGCSNYPECNNTEQIED